MDFSDLVKNKVQKQLSIAIWTQRKHGDSIKVKECFNPDYFVNQLMYGYLAMASFNQEFARTFPLFDEPLKIDEAFKEQSILNLQNEIKNL